MNKSIEEIGEIHELSVRAVNCCRYAGISTLQHLIEFYQNQKDFYSIKNAGRKVNKELKQACEFYLAPLPDTSKSIDILVFSNKISKADYLKLRSGVFETLNQLFESDRRQHLSDATLQKWFIHKGFKYSSS